MPNYWFWMYFLLLIPTAVNSRARYLLYSVNPGEGFNLRRDVHMRAANLALKLRKESSDDWQIVLPPWPHLYHWRLAPKQKWLPWKRFFDLPHLNQHVPSIEFEEFIQLSNGTLDQVGNVSTVVLLPAISIYPSVNTGIDTGTLSSELAFHQRAVYRKD